MSKEFDMRLAEWKEQIDDCLNSMVEGLGYTDEFKEILRYALFPGGKRLRPILTLEWHNLFSPPDEYALRYACGIEILHSYSLIHDDMPCMDNDDYRRGALTVHKKYGEGKALLAGDALMDLAYRILNTPTPQGKVSPFVMLAGSCGDAGLIHGQYLDLYGELRTLDELLKMYRYKTGALITLACMSGFALGNNLDYIEYDKLVDSIADGKPHRINRDADDRRIVDSVLAMGFGEKFGCAFQLYDDISEYIGGEELSATSVLKFVDLDEAKRLLNTKLNDALQILDTLNGDAFFLRELLKKFVIV